MKTLIEPMKWAFETYGEQIYSNIKSLKRNIRMVREKWIDLNTKRKDLVSNTG